MRPCWPEQSVQAPSLWQRRRLLSVCLTAAVLNALLAGPFSQIGIAQLHLPATVVAGWVAVVPLMSILRPWLGRMSDRHPLWGRRRSGYLWLGLAGTWLILPLPLMGLVAVGSHWWTIPSGLRMLAAFGEAALLMALGLANQTLQTAMNALLLDQTPEPERGRGVGEVIAASILAVLLVSTISALLLRQLAAQPLMVQLLALWCFWAAVVVPLVLVCVRGQEKPCERPEAPVPVSRRRSPLGFLDPPLVVFLLTSHAALFVPDVLLEPYATELLGWSLSSTTLLAGLWALGSLASLALTLWFGLGPARLLGCLITALVQGLLAWKALLPNAMPLPMPLLVLWLGLAAGLVQGWVADQVGRRCCGARLGERAGGWGAAIVLSRSLGLALAGPLLDGPSWALGLERGPSFATALLVSAVLALAGLVLGGPAQPQNGPSAP
jgi:BCD family chlorophyll transporter-like MFS transporter